MDNQIKSGFTNLRSLKDKYLLIFAAVLFVIFIFLGIFSLFSPSGDKKPQQTQPIQQNTTNAVPPTIAPTSIYGDAGDSFKEELDYDWGLVDFSEESDLQGLNAAKEQLPDGSLKYTFASDNPNRPDMIIVKKSAIVFTRQVVFGVTTDNYMRFLGKPEYVTRESGFYGPDSALYIYPTRGSSLTVNTITNQVYERHVFQPTTIEEFILKYKQYTR